MDRRHLFKLTGSALAMGGAGVLANTMKGHAAMTETMTPEQRRAFEHATQAVVDKWQRQTGVELIREGGKIVSYLIENGPLPQHIADAMLPDADQARGMVKYFEDRDYLLEVNAAGDIVGAGLSLIADENSRRHVSFINGRKFYNWCACDICLFPIVLGIESPGYSICPSTGETVSFVTTTTGFADLSHPDAWFTLAPIDGYDVRKIYCDRVNIYATRQAAEAAVAFDPDLAAAPIAELWTDCKKLADMF